MFVKTMDGTYYPLREVERLWQSKDDKGHRLDKVQIKDFGTIPLFYGELERLVEANAPTLPAMPGTYVLSDVIEDDNSITLERTPVLGWLISSERGVVPVTIEGVNNGADETAAVLMPDGEVVLAMSQSFEDEAAYLRSRGPGRN